MIALGHLVVNAAQFLDVLSILRLDVSEQNRHAVEAIRARRAKPSSGESGASK